MTRKHPSQIHDPHTFWEKVADRTARAAGSTITFFIAIAVILAWAASGPIFHFSDTWQLVINTGTTIITFLMVFLLQNSQNRQSEKDRIEAHEDYRVNQQAERDICEIKEKLDQLEKTLTELALYLSH